MLDVCELDVALEAAVDATHRLTGADATVLALLQTDGNLDIRVVRGAANEGTAEEIPIVWNGERLGVMTLSFEAPGALDQTKLAFTCALAQQAAIAVAQAQKLERAQRQLARNEKLMALGQLIQGLAHEMNTPLSVVIANLSVLDRYTQSLSAVGQAAQTVVPHLAADPLGAALVSPLADALGTADLEYVIEDAPSLLEESAEAARRVADLVRSMSTFARHEPNGPQPVVIQEVLEAALNLTSNVLKHRAQIQRDFTDVPKVTGRSSELAQVFVQVLLNAAQSIEGKRGAISIGTEHSGDSVLVKVTDNGCGIAPEHLDRIFEPFFSTRASADASGMGLAVASAIIQRHGGSIAVESQPQQGTTVTIRVPVAQQLGVAA